MKLSHTFIGAALILFAAFSFTGCTDPTGKNPSRPDHLDGITIAPEANLFFPAFRATDGNTGFIGMMTYLPPGYALTTQGQRYPVLYLVAPFGADERYYFEHGLAQVADRLITEGKINPMIIISLDARSQLGGSFLTNTARQGDYFEAFFNYSVLNIRWKPYRQLWETRTIYNWPVITFLEDRYRTTKDYRSRGIGGVGTGGYCAFRSALMTDLFGSLSAMNAPLDFDGTGSNGFLSLFGDAFIAGQPWPLDTSFTNPAASLVISAAAAFSPRILSMDTVWIEELPDETPKLKFSTDSLKIDTLAVPGGAGYLAKFDSYLPFGSTGTLTDVVWSRWLSHTVDSLYANATAPRQLNFDNMPKLLIRSNQAEFRFAEQMDAYITAHNALTNATYTVKSFAGTPQLPSLSDHYIYDLLEDILIFHSEQFEAE